MKQIFMSVLAGLICVFSQAQTTTLTEIFQQAASYPGLSAQSANIEAAKINYKISKREILPNLNFQAQNTYGTYQGINGAFFPTSGIFNVSGDGSSGETSVNTFISATAQWDFIQFGKHRDQVKMSKIDQDKAQTDWDLLEVELKKDLASVYISWLYSNHMMNWAKKEVERDSLILNLARSKVNSGLASAADSLLAITKLKQTLSQKKKWEAQIETSKNRITELTGMRLNDEQPAEQFLSTYQTEFLKEDSSPHPLSLSKTFEKEWLEVQEKNISHQVLPNISLLAGGMLRGVGFEDGNQWRDSYELPISNYLIGLGLSWDISGFYSKGLKKQLNQQQQIQVEEEKEVVQRHLEERENSLQNQIDKSFEEITEAEEAYEAARETFRLFKVRYESGIIDLATLLQIQQSLQFTEKSRLKAYYNYWNYWNAYAYSTADFSVLINVFN